MNSFNHDVIRHKVSLLNLAKELCNVSKACKLMGCSRGTFYRYQAAKDEGGIEALPDKNHRTPNLKNKVDPAIENAVVAFVTVCHMKNFFTFTASLAISRRKDIFTALLREPPEPPHFEAGHRHTCA